MTRAERWKLLPCRAESQGWKNIINFAKQKTSRKLSQYFMLQKLEWVNFICRQDHRFLSSCWKILDKTKNVDHFFFFLLKRVEHLWKCVEEKKKRKRCTTVADVIPWKLWSLTCPFFMDHSGFHPLVTGAPPTIVLNVCIYLKSSSWSKSSVIPKSLLFSIGNKLNSVQMTVWVKIKIKKI